MDFWIDLFTGTTWKEFQDAGATISGFPERKRSTVDLIKRGDVLLCYVTGVMRWVGALEVAGPSTNTAPIWKDFDFPVRLEVKPLLMLSPEYGVPMHSLRGKVDFFPAKPERWPTYKGFLRQSPARFKVAADGQLICALLQEAQAEPVARPVPAAKLARRPTTY